MGPAVPLPGYCPEHMAWSSVQLPSQAHGMVGDAAWCRGQACQCSAVLQQSEQCLRLSAYRVAVREQGRWHNLHRLRGWLCGWEGVLCLTRVGQRQEVGAHGAAVVLDVEVVCTCTPRDCRS